MLGIFACLLLNYQDFVSLLKIVRLSATFTCSGSNFQDFEPLAEKAVWAKAILHKKKQLPLKAALMDIPQLCSLIKYVQNGSTYVVPLWTTVLL